RLLEALDAVDGSLDDGIKTLDAETCPGDSGLTEGGDHSASQRARINLDGDLGVCSEAESAPEQAEEIKKRLGLHDCRRAAAEMQMTHRQRVAEPVCDEIYLATQRREIVGYRSIVVRDLRMATAIPAHRPAERDVQVDRAA